MTKKLFIFGCLCVSSLAATDDLILIDTIEAIIYGQEGTELITRSDVNRPPLGGDKMRSLDDIVFERLMVLDAQKVHAMPTEEETDKTINTICRENNMTKDEFNQAAAGAGYTPEGAREQFRNMHAANKMLDYKVRSRLVVPKKEVEDYCREHPESTIAEYELTYSFVPFSTKQTAAEQERDLVGYINGTKMTAQIEWSEPFWVQEPDIAKDYQFITELKPGEIKLHKALGKGFELYKLTDLKPAREKTAEDRYFEIADFLRKPRAEQLMEEYKKSLFDSTSILYLS